MHLLIVFLLERVKAFKIAISSLHYARISVDDAWHYFNPDTKGYTWTNQTMSRKSRIDLFIISPFLLQFVIDVDHQLAPFSDHHLISLNLQATKKWKGTRGYWKLNNTLLKDTTLIENIKSLAKDIFCKI